MNDVAFRLIGDTLDHPMAIVTTFDGTERSGCLVGFHTQCSIDPRRWLVCISKRNHTYRVARGAEFLVVHLLTREQHALARIFGGETGDEVDPQEKFARTAWHTNAHGIPVLDDCDWLVGGVIERIDLGDHVGHVLAVGEARCKHPHVERLGFQSVRDIDPGHDP